MGQGVEEECCMRADAAGAERAGRRAKTWIGNAAVMLGAIVAVLVPAEIALRIFAPEPMSGVVFEYAPRGYSVNRSSGSALFTVGDYRGVYHFVPPHLRGLRPPPANAVRILALGDSFTFGFGLPEQDTTIAKLQDSIDATFGSEQIALLNAGIGGTGTAEHLAFLEDFGDTIAPRAVIVFVNFDDFNRAERSPLYRLRDANSLQLQEGTAPTSRLKKLVAHSEAYDYAIQHFQVAQLIRNTVLRVMYGPSPFAVTTAANEPATMSDGSPEQQRLVRALFRRMNAWCDWRGVKLAVINNGWRSYGWLPGLLASEHIAAFDAAPQIRPVIASGVAPYVISDGVHPNPKGAKLIADAVWPYVRNFIDENGLDEPHPHR
jgi:lysophospholipase L1-like esterase